MSTLHGSVGHAFHVAAALRRSGRARRALDPRALEEVVAWLASKRARR